MSNQEDRKFISDFQNSLKVSSYSDKIIDSLYNDIPITPSADGQNGSFSNESQSLFRLDEDTIFSAAASSMGISGVSSVLNGTSLAETPSMPVKTSSKKPQNQIHLSHNQVQALRKYPALIEFLGSEDGASLVKEIAAKVNEHVSIKIGENSKEISEFAKACVSDKQNIKQYFSGHNNEWVCVVTASGYFRGDEAILYNRQKDEAFVLRKVNDDYENITHHFNIIHEAANTGEIK